MATTHNRGFPRIGAKSELKFALESYWSGQSSAEAAKTLGARLRQRYRAIQSGVDLVPTGDFVIRKLQRSYLRRSIRWDGNPSRPQR